MHFADGAAGLALEEVLTEVTGAVTKWASLKECVGLARSYG